MNDTTTALPVHPVTGLTALAVIGGRPVWPILGGSGDGEADDTAGGEDTGDNGEQETDGDQADDGQAGDDAADADADADDDAPLGPKGEKALAAEKERRRAESKRRRALEAELAALKAGGTQDDPETIRREATHAATAKANARIVRSEVRAVAAGRLADPADALTFLDLDAFEVGEDGDVDTDEIADAISDLLHKKPYLAAATAKRFQGTGDGGAARTPGRPKQLTREALKTMTPEQIEQARIDGRLDNVLNGR